MSDNLRDLISDIAVDHQIDDDSPHGGWLCTCGREFLIDSPETFQSWDGHLADEIIDQLLDLAGHGKLLAAINTIAAPKSYCNRCGIPHTEKCLRP